MFRKDIFLQLQDYLTNFEEQKRYHMEDYLDLLTFKTEIDTLSDSLRVARISNRQNMLERIMTSDFKKGRVAAEHLLEEADLDEKEPFLVFLPKPENSNRSVNSNNKKEAKSFDFANTKDLIEVYPNPVDDILTVEYLMFNGLSANTIGIYDINGRLLITQNITKAMDVLDINVSQLSTGTYIIAFGKDGVSSNSTKFIVK